MSEYKFETDYQSKIVQAERRGENRGENRILELLESGKAPEEILKLYGKNI
jgi:hypothetical protein